MEGNSDKMTRGECPDRTRALPTGTGGHLTNGSSLRLRTLLVPVLAHRRNREAPAQVIWASASSRSSCARSAGGAPTLGHRNQPTRRVPPFACRCEASAISISCRCHSLMASCNGPGFSTGCLNRVETSIVSSCEPVPRSGLTSRPSQ